MRSTCSNKTLSFIAILVVFMILYFKLQIQYDSHPFYRNKIRLSHYNTKITVNSDTVNNGKEKPSDLKYILQWVPDNTDPYLFLHMGQQGFIDKKCQYTNCYATSNLYENISDFTKFDVIAFPPEIVKSFDFPNERTPHQKYVFASLESADNYPVCSHRFDGFFNWTWTYKINSDVRWGYIVIRDENNALIGPNKDINWKKLEAMDPISEDFKSQLRNKTKAAAWFVSNCFVNSHREFFVAALQEELSQYDLGIDIYGKCGDLTCSRDDENECEKLIKDMYYFYLSFENSFSEDYVTEKLYRALKSDAVPIVYGGANYTRFMPDGIYLNARELGVEELATKMYELINDPEEYANFFRWKKYYKYNSIDMNIDTDPYCLVCSLLNNEEMMKNITIYEDFSKWWDPPNRCYTSGVSFLNYLYSYL